MEDKLYPIQPAPQVPTTIKKSSRWLLIISFVFIVFLIISGAVLLGLYNGKKSSVVELSPVPPIEQIQTDGMADTAPSDWKIYANSRYFYSLKYPKEWVVKIDDPGSESNSTSESILLFPNGQEELSLRVETDQSSIYQKSSYSQWIVPLVDNNRMRYKSTKESTMTVSGVSAIVLETEIIDPLTPPYNKQILFSIPEKDGYFSISIISETKQDSMIFDQVISSFKFIN